MTAGLFLETSQPVQPLPSEAVVPQKLKASVLLKKIQTIEEECVSLTPPSVTCTLEKAEQFVLHQGPCLIAACVCLLLILAIPVYHSLRGLHVNNQSITHILRATTEKQQYYDDVLLKVQEQMRQLQWNVDDRQSRIFHQLEVYENRIRALESRIAELQDQKPAELPRKEVARYFGHWDTVTFELKEREEIEIIVSITAHGGPEWNLKGIVGLTHEEDGAKQELGDIVWYVNDRHKHSTAPTFFWMGVLEAGTYHLNIQPVNTLADPNDILSVLVKRA